MVGIINCLNCWPIRRTDLDEQFALEVMLLQVPIDI
jgi:hypothetical protein